MVRYCVTVKESEDRFYAFHMSKIYKWMFEYEHHVLNQDEPWEPNFVITTETIGKGEHI